MRGFYIIMRARRERVKGSVVLQTKIRGIFSEQVDTYEERNLKKLLHKHSLGQMDKQTER